MIQLSFAIGDLLLFISAQRWWIAYNFERKHKKGASCASFERSHQSRKRGTARLFQPVGVSWPPSNSTHHNGVEVYILHVIDWQKIPKKSKKNFYNFDYHLVYWVKIGGERCCTGAGWYSSCCYLFILRVETTDCGDEAAEWLDSVLQEEGCRLRRHYNWCSSESAENGNVEVVIRNNYSSLSQLQTDPT